MELLTNWSKKIGLIFALLFTFELIFGYSGTMIMVKGLAIRHILFIISAVLLYIYCFLYTYINKIKWFDFKSKTSVFGSFTLMDWAILLFAISTVFSFLVIPQIYGGSLELAKREILDAFCMLLFYFPIRFMIYWQEISFEKFEKFILICLSFLALLHIVLYVGQALNGNFIEGYFDFLSTLSGNTAITPGIVLGHGGYPRVMYSTSIYLLIGFYLLIKKLPKWKIFDYIAMALFVVALFTTMTKSLWYGVFIGLGLFTVFYIVHCLMKKQWKQLGQWLLILCGSALLVVTLNATLFDGIVSARLTNSFAITENNSHESHEKYKNKYMDLDNEGAVTSNNIKVKQSKLLLQAWEIHTIFGVGYGSYLENYLRSEKAVFSYEMFLPAMLFKVGILGIGLLLSIVICSVVQGWKNTRGRPLEFFAWFGLLLAFGFCIQTNPLLLSFNGISVILYILWCCCLMKQKNAENRCLS
ncbi:MAG: hypothetical protein RSA04_02285 [Clostridiales bacterium]